jgi:hypothetical protein
MRRAWLVAVVITSMSAMSAPNAYAQADNCKDVLANGIWEYNFSDTDAHHVSAFLTWY